MAKDNNSRCNFNHSVNVILFAMFFIVLIAVSFNGCLNSTCKGEQSEQAEQNVNEPIVHDTKTPQDSLVANQ